MPDESHLPQVVFSKYVTPRPGCASASPVSSNPRLRYRRLAEMLFVPVDTTILPAVPACQHNPSGRLVARAVIPGAYALVKYGTRERGEEASWRTSAITRPPTNGSTGRRLRDSTSDEMSSTSGRRTVRPWSGSGRAARSAG